MPESITIEPISEQHIEQFRECLDEVAREGQLAFLEAPPLEQVREFVSGNTRRNIPAFVAVSGSTIIGWCDILPLRMPGFTHRGRLGMGVRASFRRTGLGMKLIQACLDQARQQNIERVELEVFASNEPAIALYRKLGFHEEGRHVRARKLDDRYDDLIWMALFLS